MSWITESACTCGQKVLIEHDAEQTCRRDGKRVFYSRDEDTGRCAFRCRACRQPVNETVPGAEYGAPRPPQVYAFAPDVDLEQQRRDAARWQWLASDCDGNAQADFVRWLSGIVTDKASIDAKIDGLRTAAALETLGTT